MEIDTVRVGLEYLPAVYIKARQVDRGNELIPVEKYFAGKFPLAVSFNLNIKPF